MTIFRNNLLYETMNDGHLTWYIEHHPIFLALLNDKIQWPY